MWYICFSVIYYPRIFITKSPSIAAFKKEAPVIALQMIEGDTYDLKKDYQQAVGPFLYLKKARLEKKKGVILVIMFPNIYFLRATFSEFKVSVSFLDSRISLWW